MLVILGIKASKVFLRLPYSGTNHSSGILTLLEASWAYG